MEELEQAKRQRGRLARPGYPERLRQIQSLRLARTEMQRQLEATTHGTRRKQIRQAIVELTKRLTALGD